MEEIEEINTILYKLQQLLYGYNYEVVFGAETFANCQTTEEFKIRLKEKFPNTRPEDVVLIPMTTDDFWADIEFALEYRGDSWAGVEISGSKLEQFENLKRAFINFLNERIKPDSRIFSYPDEKGIPGYPVWWDFRFIILCDHGDALFVFGSASD